MSTGRLRHTTHTSTWMHLRSRERPDMNLHGEVILIGGSLSARQPPAPLGTPLYLVRRIRSRCALGDVGTCVGNILARMYVHRTPSRLRTASTSWSGRPAAPLSSPPVAPRAVEALSVMVGLQAPGEPPPSSDHAEVARVLHEGVERLCQPARPKGHALPHHRRLEFVALAAQPP